MFYLAPFALIALRRARRRRRRATRATARARSRPRRRRRPAVLHPVRALHHDERRLRHLRAAAVVVGAGPPHPLSTRCAGRRSASRSPPRRSSCCCRAATRSSCRRSSPSTSSATAFVVENGRHGIHKTTVGSLWAGTHMAAPGLDRPRSSAATPSVAVLWTGAMPLAYPVYENEFFNRSVRTVYDVDGAARPDPLPETDVTRSPERRARLRTGSPIRAQYVLASTARVEVAGKRDREPTPSASTSTGSTARS